MGTYTLGGMRIKPGSEGPSRSVEAPDLFGPHTTLLAVVAHPDDESFGLGAVIAAAVGAGARVGVLCLSRGEASTVHGVAGDLAAIRERELEDAARVLGAGWVRLADHPDGELATAQDALDLDVRAAVGQLDPDLLLVFDTTGITGHPDHIAASQSALRVAREQDVDVLAWTLPEPVASAMALDGWTGFVGRLERDIDLVLTVERSRQREAVQRHPSQAVPGSPLWRRLDLLGGHEHLRWLRHRLRTGELASIRSAV